MAGAVARTAVVFATSPLELLRVRMQGERGAAAPGRPYGQHIAQVARQVYHEGQVRATQMRWCSNRVSDASQFSPIFVLCMALASQLQLL